MPVLFGELPAKTFNEDLLIDGVNVEDYDQDDQTEDGIADFNVEKGFQSLMQGRKRRKSPQK